MPNPGLTKITAENDPGPVSADRGNVPSLKTNVLLINGVMNTQTTAKLQESISGTCGNIEISGENNDRNKRTETSSTRSASQNPAPLSDSGYARSRGVTKSVFSRPNLLL